jgi:hypothetical protein
MQLQIENFHLVQVQKEKTLLLFLLLQQLQEHLKPVMDALV